MWLRCDEVRPSYGVAGERRGLLKFEYVCFVGAWQDEQEYVQKTAG